MKYLLLAISMMTLTACGSDDQTPPPEDAYTFTGRYCGDASQCTTEQPVVCLNRAPEGAVFLDEQVHGEDSFVFVPTDSEDRKIMLYSNGCGVEMEKASHE